MVKRIHNRIVADSKYDIWPTWVINNNTITYATTTEDHGIWYGWNASNTGNVTITNCRVWGSWNATPYTIRTWTPTEYPRTDHETFRITTERREAARRTARQLLLAHLDPLQRETCERNGYFDFISELGRQYRIFTNRGKMHNVFLIDRQGVHLFELCAYTPGVPDDDNAMAQKLYLETNERAFLQAANIWDRRPGKERTVSHEGSWYDFPVEAVIRSESGLALAA